MFARDIVAEIILALIDSDLMPRTVFDCAPMSTSGQCTGASSTTLTCRRVGWAEQTLAKQGVMGQEKGASGWSEPGMARFQIAHMQMYTQRETPRLQGNCDELRHTALAHKPRNHEETNTHTHTHSFEQKKVCSNIKQEPGAKEGFSKIASGFPCDVDVGRV